jgi:hypothetical protein
MLPAWATVVISLGSATIGAFAGFFASWLTYRGARETQQREESVAWRNQQLEACRAMSDAWLEFRWLVYEPLIASRPFDDRPFDEKVLGQVGPLGTRCAQCVARVILLVGRDKSGSAGVAAADVDEKISRLKDSVLDRKKSWSTKLGEKIEREIKAAEKAHEMFVELAHPEVRPKS